MTKNRSLLEAKYTTNFGTYTQAQEGMRILNLTKNFEFEKEVSLQRSQFTQQRWLVATERGFFKTFLIKIQRAILNRCEVQMNQLIPLTASKITFRNLLKGKIKILHRAKTCSGKFYKEL